MIQRALPGEVIQGGGEIIAGKQRGRVPYRGFASIVHLKLQPFKGAISRQVEKYLPPVYIYISIWTRV